MRVYILIEFLCDIIACQKTKPGFEGGQPVLNGPGFDKLINFKFLLPFYIDDFKIGFKKRTILRSFQMAFYHPLF